MIDNIDWSTLNTERRRIKDDSNTCLKDAIIDILRTLSLCITSIAKPAHAGSNRPI